MYFHFSCKSGCSNDTEPVVAVGGRKVFEYICTDNCVTIYSNLSETWSAFLLDDHDQYHIGADLVPTEGFLLSQSKKQETI